MWTLSSTQAALPVAHQHKRFKYMYACLRFKQVLNCVPISLQGGAEFGFSYLMITSYLTSQPQKSKLLLGT